MKKYKLNLNTKIQGLYLSLEPLKRKIFEDYKSTLMSMEKSLADKSIL